MMRWPIILALGLLGLTDIPGLAAAPAVEQAAAAKQQAERLAKLPAVTPRTVGKTDASGRKQHGNASYYAPKFNHRKMADGRRLNTNANMAASKSLPLGSVAKVTNLENGHTATVAIQDRGPYAPSRVMDVTLRVAEKLAMKEQGVVPVEIQPITVPKADGSVKLGAGAVEASTGEVRGAIATTRQLTLRPDAPVSP
jgi:rare lipoprotein A